MLGLMKEKGLGITMKRGYALVVCLILLIPLASAGDGGINKEVDIEGTPISGIETPSTSIDGEAFDITVTLNQENNVTGVSWTWQICLNTGVCLAPVDENMTSSDGGNTWTTSMTPVEEHSYVNYRITLDHNDGNSTSYPESGWGGKVWSDCWASGGESGGEGCEDGGILPGFTMLASVAMIGLVAIVTRRN